MLESTTEDFTSFLRQKFVEGAKMTSDVGIKNKKALLTANSLPWCNTEILNVISVFMRNKTYSILLINKEEDQEERYIKVRENDEEDWRTVDIKFFISQYQSSFASQGSVADWLKGFNFSFIERPPDLLEVVTENFSQTLYIKKEASYKGHIVVRYKTDGKDYYFSREKLLQTLRGENAPKRGRHKPIAVN